MAINEQLLKDASEFLKGFVTPKTNLELFNEILAGRIQKELSLRLKKIYPLALCEIRVFEIREKKN